MSEKTIKDGGCDCVTTVNAMLADHNAAVSINLFGPARTFVETYKVDAKKRGKPPLMAATFCPFCGTKYPEAINLLAARTDREGQGNG